MAPASKPPQQDPGVSPDVLEAIDRRMIAEHTEATGKATVNYHLRYIDAIGGRLKQMLKHLFAASALLVGYSVFKHELAATLEQMLRLWPR